MNIIFINGSPKGEKSCSKYLLETIKSKIIEEKNIYEISIADKSIRDEDKFHIISNCNKVLIAFPLYVDCLPGMVIKFLEGLECYLNKNNLKNEVKVYGIVNCGFLEGYQNKQALNIIRNFTKHIGNLKYCGGIGIGGGPFLEGSRNMPWEFGIKIKVKEGLDNLTNAINNGDTLENDLLVNVNMNKRLYMLSGELGWIISGLKNKVYLWSFNKKHYK